MEISRFDQIVGHQSIIRLLQASLEHPAAAYLFLGPAHVGKRTVAEVFMKQLLGLTEQQSLISHPDFSVLEPLEGKNLVSVEQVRDFRERASLKPMQASRSVMFFPHADRLNDQGMNALLKVMEEPPAQAVFVMLAEDVSRIPRTVQSRAVILNFQRVPIEQLQEALMKQGVSNNDSKIESLKSRGLPGKVFGSSAGEVVALEAKALELAERLVHARSIGAQLEQVEFIAKWCDDQEDAVQAWSMWGEQMSRLLISQLASRPELLGLAHGVLQMWRTLGSAVPPRIGLEAAITQGAQLPEIVSHLPRPLGVVYLEQDV